MPSTPSGRRAAAPRCAIPAPGWGGRFPNIGGLFEFLGTQAGIIGPVPFVAFFVALAGRAALDTEPKRLLASWSLPVFALIALQAIISKANGNWAAAGFPAAVVLATAAMVRLEWRRGMIATLVLSVLCLFGFAFYGSLAGVVTTGPDALTNMSTSERKPTSPGR